MVDRFIKKLAPHLLVGLEGTSLKASERLIISETPPSGIVLFSRNVKDTGQLCELTAEIRTVVREACGLPPIITADHEGGRISVLAEAIGAPPTQMAAARTLDEPLCRRLFSETARRMRSCGLNMVLGPVADVNSEYLNPVVGTRAFSEDREETASLVSLAVETFRNTGLLTCVKHFPGHGSAVNDSHSTLPVLGATIEGLRERDLLPFVRGIEAGADAVMVGHIAAADSNGPASLDPLFVSGMLRGEMGFGGVVVTDALEMAGVLMREPLTDAGGRAVGNNAAARRGLSEVVRLAFEAGNDLLLFSRPVEEVFEELGTCFRQKKEELDFWDERFMELSGVSYGRIEKLRRKTEEQSSGATGSLKRSAFGSGEVGVGADTIRMQRYDESVYREVSRRSLHVSLDKGRRLERSPALTGRFVFYGERSDFGNGVVKRFLMRVIERATAGQVSQLPSGAVHEGSIVGESLKAVLVDRTPNVKEPVELLQLDRGEGPSCSPRIIFLLNRRPLTREAVTTLCAEADVVVVAGWPYAARFVPTGKDVIVSYGIYDAAADAVCDALPAQR